MKCWRGGKQRVEPNRASRLVCLPPRALVFSGPGATSRNEKVRANLMVRPDDRPPREFAASHPCALHASLRQRRRSLSQPSPSNIGPPPELTLAIFADCAGHAASRQNGLGLGPGRLIEVLEADAAVRLLAPWVSSSH